MNRTDCSSPEYREEQGWRGRVGVCRWGAPDQRCSVGNEIPPSELRICSARYQLYNLRQVISTGPDFLYKMGVKSIPVHDS